MNVLITGASGRIGRTLAAGLASVHRLRLADVQRGDVGSAGEWIECDVTHPRDAARAVSGMDAVVHLAGHPNSRDWHVVQSLNVGGTLTMLKAASEAGVPRFLFASSIHVCGFYPADVTLTSALAPWPDSPYGVSKAMAEMLVRYFAERGDLIGISMRICSFRPSPTNARELATWISPGDMVRLVEACLSADVSGFRAIWGISANSRARLRDGSWEELGYRPRDNADDHVSRLASAGVDVSPYSEWPLLGAAFAEPAPR